MGEANIWNGTSWVSITDEDHRTASDPHSQYQLDSVKGAANGYAGLDSGGKVPIGQLPTGATSSTVALGDHNHGATTHNHDDRYYTEAEVDTAVSSHNHDARYYTETEIDGLVAGKANTSHTHGAADVASGTLSIARIPLGSTASTVTVGDDARLTDARIPTGTAGGDLAGSYPSPTIKSALNDPTAATPGLRTLGGGAQQATAGNDARLSNARTPTTHAASHAAAGSDPITPGAIGAARYGLVYPLYGYGDWHSASCVGEHAQTQSSFSSWHLRIWISPGKPIVRFGMAITGAGVPAAGTWLNKVAIYEDDGQTFLGTSDDLVSMFSTAGPRSTVFPAEIPGDPAREFIRLIINLDGWNTSPSVNYTVPGGDQGYSINGAGPLQRRSAFKSPYAGSFPAAIDPNTLGTPTNFLPFVVLG